MIAKVMIKYIEIMVNFARLCENIYNNALIS